MQWMWNAMGTRDEVIRALDRHRPSCTPEDEAQINRVKQMLAQELSTWPAGNVVLELKGRAGVGLRIELKVPIPAEPVTSEGGSAEPKAEAGNMEQLEQKFEETVPASTEPVREEEVPAPARRKRKPAAEVVEEVK